MIEFDKKDRCGICRRPLGEHQAVELKCPAHDPGTTHSKRSFKETEFLGVGSIVYLATPYSHDDPEIRRQRFEIVNRIAAKMMSEGKIVYSPISHTHPIALAGDLPTGWDFWKKYDRAMLAACSEVTVVCQPGWDESVGVKAEVKIAVEMGLPVVFMAI